MSNKLLFSFLCLCAFVFVAFAHSEDKVPPYIIVIDAGSTGTRVRVYKVGMVDGVYTVVKEDTDKVKIPITKYIEPSDVDKVGPDIFTKLIKVANGVTGNDKNVPVILGATAGVRSYLEGGTDKENRRKNAEKLFETISKYVESQGFKKVKAFKLDGPSEGTYGWLAANHLLGAINLPKGQCGLDKHKDCRSSLYCFLPVRLTNTFTTLETGGASVQETYEIYDPESFRRPSRGLRKQLTSLSEDILRWRFVDECSFDLFQAGYDGFGLDKIKERIADTMARSSDKKCPCYAPSVNLDKFGKFTETTGAFCGSESTSFELCSKFIRHGILGNQDVYKNPSPLINTDPLNVGNASNTYVLIGNFGTILGRVYLNTTTTVELTLADIEHMARMTCAASATGKPKNECIPELSKIPPLGISHTTSVVKAVTPYWYCDKVQPVFEGEQLCMTLSYYVVLLRDIYGITNDARIIAASANNANIEYSWGVGLALEYLYENQLGVRSCIE